MAAMHNSIEKLSTTTNVVPVLIKRNVVTEHASSHDIVHLGKLDLSRTLQEVSVSLNQLHSFHILGSGNDALINSLHLISLVRNEIQTKTLNMLIQNMQCDKQPQEKQYILLENKVGVECDYS